MSDIALYRGTIRHRRFTPIPHEFTYRLTMPMLNLDTVAQDLRMPGLLGTRFPALGWFRRQDYAGNPNQQLEETIRDRVVEQTGWRPNGPIRVLTHLRYWGFVMNPISIFYCHDRHETLRYLVLQVTNTPWREKILYVVPVHDDQAKQCHRFGKEMHVSPFNPMDMEYLCRFRAPGNKLFFHLENHSQGERHTDATLVLERLPGTLPRLIGLVLRQPAMTIKTGFGIYWQALRLWIKGVPVHDHPGRKMTANENQVTP